MRWLLSLLPTRRPKPKHEPFELQLLREVAYSSSLRRSIAIIMRATVTSPPTGPELIASLDLAIRRAERASRCTTDDRLHE